MKPEDLITFAKEKGFIYPSSAIYGGLAGFYDYGHNGAPLKKKFENIWRKFFLNLNDNFHEIEAANIMHENTFVASGHLKNFTDPVLTCSKCGFFARADHFIEQNTKERAEGLTEEQYDELVKKNNLVCPSCKSPFKKAAVMNLMYSVNLGVGEGQKAYLRPETAQSTYVDFKTQFKLLREKLPLGIALIGRSYRNEISPRNFVIRQREFTQAELQIFFNPNNQEHEDFDLIKDEELEVVFADSRDKKTKTKASDMKLPQFYVYYLARIQQFYRDVLNISMENFRLYQLNDQEKAFYNKYHFDIEVNLEGHGWTEVGGLHYRTDHDLKGHEEVSKEKMEVNVDGQKFIPHVLEISMGVDRNVYSLIDQHVKDDERGNLVFSLPTKLAPKEVAVFPLVNKNVEKAKEVYEIIREEFDCFYDKSGSVGRRYARADEMGVPFCITVDFEEGVTIRSRDSTEQIRVKEEDLVKELKELVKGKKNF